MKIAPDLDFVKKNYDKTIELLHEQGSPLESLVDSLGERYALAPASSKKEFYSSFPGGLAFHNLHMYFWMKKFVQSLGVAADPLELLNISILHELGKVGDEKEDYYIPIESDWHRERGIFYEINPKIQFMRTPHRSLYWAQQSGVTLSQDVYMSVLLYEGRQEDSVYKYKQPSLSTATQFAHHYSTHLEKKNEVFWP